MRIAIITENFLPKLDGVTRTVARLLGHLQATNHQVLLLGPASGMEQYAGAEVIGTFGLPLPFYPELKANVFRPLFLRRLSEFRPEVIHLVDPVMLGAAGLVAANVLRIPVVSSYHTNLAAYSKHFGFGFLAEPIWAYIRFIHSRCALTFCPSPSTEAMLRSRGFAHLRLWPRGVDVTLFRPARRNGTLRETWLMERTHPEDKVILLYVGRLSWEKNLRLLAQAYSGMDHSCCHLVIVGDGPARSDLQQALHGLPVTFTGYLSGEALATAYASAEVFAFPSTTETFGQVVLEAMASGLPVVGLLADGVRDLVTDEQTGLLLAQEHLSW
jgi:glycosyltransferase involved in cell wall biosynthesis